jgi:hypothetical protein
MCLTSTLVATTSPDTCSKQQFLHSSFQSGALYATERSRCRAHKKHRPVQAISPSQSCSHLHGYLSSKTLIPWMDLILGYSAAGRVSCWCMLAGMAEFWMFESWQRPSTILMLPFANVLQPIVHPSQSHGRSAPKGKHTGGQGEWHCICTCDLPSPVQSPHVQHSMVIFEVRIRKHTKQRRWHIGLFVQPEHSAPVDQLARSHKQPLTWAGAWPKLKEFMAADKRETLQNDASKKATTQTNRDWCHPRSEPRLLSEPNVSIGGDILLHNIALSLDSWPLCSLPCNSHYPCEVNKLLVNRLSAFRLSFQRCPWLNPRRHDKSPRKFDNC